jgi:secernin
MCDTLCARYDHDGGGMLFAKNSDRPAGEVQLVEAHDRRRRRSALTTQYLTIADRDAAATVGSRPAWLWGFEHGINEHRLAVGNEKVWTVDDPRQLPPALLGMDLVRLALERATNAGEAVDVIAALLAEHGQGGSGEADRNEPYFSSFLAADPSGAWIVETSGRRWAARAVDRGAISNRIGLGRDWDRAAPGVAPGTDIGTWRSPRVPTAIADHRLAVTERATGTSPTPRTLAATLRDHGGPPGTPPPAEVGDDFSGVTVCMHVGVETVTTAAMITDLPADPARPVRAWFATGSPCVSVFLPAFPPHVPEVLADPAVWHRLDRLRNRAEQDGDDAQAIRAVLDPLEAELWEEADLQPLPEVFVSTAGDRFLAALDRLDG